MGELDRETFRIATSERGVPGAVHPNLGVAVRSTALMHLFADVNVAQSHN